MRKRIRPIFGLLFLSGMFWTCQSSDERLQKAEKEVFAIHDELMPKMDDIMVLKKRLTQRITLLDSLKANGSATTTLRTSEEKEQATRLKSNLVLADSLMMDWMNRYNEDTLTKLSSEEAMQYLTAQKDQLTDVKTKFTTSIEQARQFLGKP